jgi:hypothetical protein
MNIHRVTAEITDERLANYQGHFNVNDNGDLGVKYLMKDITKDQLKIELGKRETKRYKHLAIRAVLEMFVNTSTMMLNNIVSNPPLEMTQFQQTLDEFENLRVYVNESLMRVSSMKNCSVPQIGANWGWSPFNKAPKKERPVKKKKEDSESSDDEQPQPTAQV